MLEFGPEIPGIGPLAEAAKQVGVVASGARVGFPKFWLLMAPHSPFSAKFPRLQS